jgi:hypothetical protein
MLERRAPAREIIVRIKKEGYDLVVVISGLERTGMMGKTRWTSRQDERKRTSRIASSQYSKGDDSMPLLG